MERKSDTSINMWGDWREREKSLEAGPHLGNDYKHLGIKNLQRGITSHWPEWSSSKKSINTKCWGGCGEKGRLLTLFVRMQVGTATMENSTEVI